METKGNPGRYDQQAMDVVTATKARVVVVLVLGGESGDGFSVSGHGTAALDAAQSGEISYMLRAMADIVGTQPPDGVRVSD
jgi:hypothetical protein